VGESLSRQCGGRKLYQSLKRELIKRKISTDHAESRADVFDDIAVL